MRYFRRLDGLARRVVTCVAAAVVLFAGLVLPRPAHAAEDFDAWLANMKQEALAAGITQATVDAAFKDVQPIPKVLELDQRQPEFTLKLADYLARNVNDKKVEQGRAAFSRNRELLTRVAARFHVQPRFIVALWGIESAYGRSMGSYSEIGSLATLAYDGRRSTYFKGELIAALKILDQEKIEPEQMLGSWAGAMGQCQFMPSSFLKFAVDFDGDGRRDIWHSEADVLASTANYLAETGWRDDETWGRPVTLPASFDVSQADLSITKPLGEWRGRGVKRSDGGELPGRAAMPASIMLPEGETNSAYLVYGNFRSIMKWNRSTFFAIAVGVLADRIGDR